MNNKEITKQNKDKVDQLIQNIVSMSKDDYKKIVKSMSNFYNYSVVNQFLLNVAEASQVAGFKTWQKHGRKVKKGAKAIWILAPMIGKNKKGDEEVFGFRSIPVFDIANTEGDELKRLTKKSKIGFEEVKKVAVKLGYEVDFKPMKVALGGYISKEGIKINSNLDEANNVGTLVHEIAHGVLGHLDTTEDHSRKLDELQAETVTAIVCDNLGVERNSEYYLKGYGLDTDIKKSFNQINKAAKTILKEFNNDKK